MATSREPPPWAGERPLVLFISQTNLPRTGDNEDNVKLTETQLPVTPVRVSRPQYGERGSQPGGPGETETGKAKTGERGDVRAGGIGHTVHDVPHPL